MAVDMNVDVGQLIKGLFSKKEKDFLSLLLLNGEMI